MARNKKVHFLTKTLLAIVNLNIHTHTCYIYPHLRISHLRLSKLHHYENIWHYLRLGALFFCTKMVLLLITPVSISQLTCVSRPAAKRPPRQSIGRCGPYRTWHCAPVRYGRLTHFCPGTTNTLSLGCARDITQAGGRSKAGGL